MNPGLTREISPGPIALFGSGETSPSGRKIFEAVFRRLPEQPVVALLETPAGFELNSAEVIERIGQFITQRLQNYQPKIVIVPARMRGTEFSPDDPAIVQPLYEADLIFMGPGSPSYAVRQLKDSLAWAIIMARHRAGAALALASAAVIAIGTYALPVYEIYKVGEDLHWVHGLDLLGYYGVHLVMLPHWNNQDGGQTLDTSRCFIGQGRFERMLELLPSDLTVVGIDEKTGLVIDPPRGSCEVIGSGGVTLVPVSQGGQEAARDRGLDLPRFGPGAMFSLSKLGVFDLPPAGVDLPSEVWQKAQDSRLIQQGSIRPEKSPSHQVLRLVRQREQARIEKDWPAADRLREELENLGWRVKDTPHGSILESL